MMDSDDDDIYPDHEPQTDSHGHTEVKMEDVEDGEEEGEEVEDEDDSDDEINFITDAKQDVKTEPISTATTSTTNAGSQQKRPPGLSQTTSAQDIRKPSTPIPTIKAEFTPQPQNIQTQQQQQQQRRSHTPLETNTRPGSSYPARHVSTLDPQNGNPVHPLTGKPILQTDLDTDFNNTSATGGGGDDDKPWRKPGADITDFFNYGFDEFTWASYCLKRQEVPKEIKAIKDDAEQMKSFLEGMGGAAGGGAGAPGGMPGMPSMGGGQGQNNANGAPGQGGVGGGVGGMPGMPGMPSEVEMQQMFNAMMAQGIDPSQMDMNQMMAMMMGGGGGGGAPGGPSGGYPGGSQVPSGPAGFGGGFDQGGAGGFGGGGGGGGGGGRGRGRRGRGNW